MASEGMNLAQLGRQQIARVVAVDGGDEHGERLREIGFIAGTEVRYVRTAPLGDPRLYEVRGARICLRSSDARRIQVELI